MTRKELKELSDALPARGKLRLSLDLGVDPSKITKAFYGQVKDEKFMARLQAKAKKLIAENKMSVPIQE